MKDVSNVEPAYLISLHFYAAISMEMCARPLNTPSTYRADLFQQARNHYDRASQLVRDAEESAQSKFRASFSLLSLSSPHSPSGSTSSRAWTSETGLSSPTPSVCSSEDLNPRLHQSHFPSPPNLSSFPKPAPRKKVSFELPKDEPAILEPYIRPDSPTLGFDDEYFVTGLARQDLPRIPTCSKKSPVSGPTLHQAGDDDATPRALRDFYSLGHLSQGPLDVESEFDRRSFQLDKSTSRYCEHLSNLKSRLARHRANLEDIIETPVGEGDIADRSSTPVDDGTRCLDRKARIERLRRSGWQRKRFDPSRYEALRNAALSELS
ncbi:hypothetical protein Sste5346_000672 [Sporothrix stenoceras]|uniref:Uncharacterized protein n=1 Tax=Sporothrix stenoceras TaxID=5173 RepID=A0ABR3ZRI7_9PEZI